MHTYDSPEWGEWYDTYFGTYEDDFEFMLNQALSAKGPVLEIGCGTGRLLVPMLQQGVDAHGIDVSEYLLSKLHDKLDALKLKSKNVFRKSMVDFSLKQRFEKILISFRTINHCPDPESLIAALKNFRKHLKPGGELIISTWVPHPDVINSVDNTIKATGVIEDPKTGSPVLVSSYYAEVDTIRQSHTVIWIFEELQTEDNPNPQKVFLPVTQRWIYVSEMSLALKLASFKHAEVVGGFSGEELTESSDEQIWIAQK